MINKSLQHLTELRLVTVVCSFFTSFHGTCRKVSHWINKVNCIKVLLLLLLVSSYHTNYLIMCFFFSITYSCEVMNALRQMTYNKKKKTQTNHHRSHELELCGFIKRIRHKASLESHLRFFFFFFFFFFAIFHFQSFLVLSDPSTVNVACRAYTSTSLETALQDAETTPDCSEIDSQTSGR